MLILNNNLSYDNLKILSKINDDTDNIDIYNYILKNNNLISYDSKIIETHNNTIILEAIRNFIDLFFGFISDYPITKIDILRKINNYNNDNDNDDNIYEVITSVIPEINYVDIIAQSNPEIQILINPIGYNIDKVNKKIYKLPDFIAQNPYYNTFYKLYLDVNLDNNTDIKNNQIKDVGVFICDMKIRGFSITHYMTEI